MIKNYNIPKSINFKGKNSNRSIKSKSEEEALTQEINKNTARSSKEYLINTLMQPSEKKTTFSDGSTVVAEQSGIFQVSRPDGLKADLIQNSNKSLTCTFPSGKKANVKPLSSSAFLITREDGTQVLASMKPDGSFDYKEL